MSNLANRVAKLENKFGVEEKTFIIRVIWDGEEPTHYLVNGKLYKNDDAISEAIRADLGDVDAHCIRVLWEPINVEA